MLISCFPIGISEIVVLFFFVLFFPLKIRFFWGGGFAMRILVPLLLLLFRMINIRTRGIN